MSRWLPGRRAAAPALTALVAVAVAWPAVRNGWSGVDEDLYARGWLALYSLAPDNVWHRLLGPGPRWQYQPTVYVSHAVDHALFGEDPRAFHAVGVLLYALVCALTTATARAVLERVPGLTGRERTLAAFVGGALFAAHPLHVENFAWLGGRKDPLAVLFALAAFLLARRARARGSPVALVVAAHAALVLALGAKVTVAAAALAIALDAAFDPGRAGLRPRLRRAARHGASYVLLAAGLVVAWFWAIRGSGVLADEVGGGAVAHALFALRCLGRYAANLVAPVGLTLLPTPRFDAGAVARDLAWLALAGGAVAVGLRRPGPARRLVALGAGWAVVNLAPLCTIKNFYVNDRYMLLPMVGLAVTAGGLVALGLRGRARPWVAGVVALTLAATSALTVLRVPDWRDAEALWAAVARADPGNMHATMFEATRAAADGDVEAARALLLRAQAGRTSHAGGHLALVLDRAGHPEAADALLDELARDEGADPRALEATLAQRALDRDDPAAALRHAEAALAARPRDAGMLAVAGRARLALGDPAGALPLLRRSVDLNARVDNAVPAALAAEAVGALDEAAALARLVERAAPNWTTRLVLGRVALAQGRQVEALAALRAARRLLPPDAPVAAVNEVAVALAAAGATAEAADHLRAALAAGGGSAAAAFNLARLEALLGRPAAARARLAEAVAADPALAERARADPLLSRLP